MQNRSSKRRPRDPNQLAASIVEEATEETPVEEEAEPQKLEQDTEGKNPAAVALGRLGGQKGGKARAVKLSPEQRKEIARKAAQARWTKESNS